LIRDAVLYNRSSATPPEDPDQRAEFNEAMRMITEYNMHEDGITYLMQGYHTLEGEVPARVIDEYLLCNRIYSQAKNELARRARRRP